MKHTVFSTLAIIAMTLTACSSSFTSTSAGSTQASSASPTELQLAVGILKLEGTENEVTAEQAPELLMLWQVYQELGQSDTAAQEEVEALIEQVQETMTAQQIQAITAMQITQQDVAAAMQGSSVFTNSSQSNNNSATSSNSGMPAGGPQDGGVPPDMGGGAMPADFAGSGGQTTSNGQTQYARTGSGLGGSAGIPTALVDMLIQVLEQKIVS